MQFKIVEELLTLSVEEAHKWLIDECGEKKDLTEERGSAVLDLLTEDDHFQLVVFVTKFFFKSEGDVFVVIDNIRRPLFLLAEQLCMFKTLFIILAHRNNM